MEFERGEAMGASLIPPLRRAIEGVRLANSFPFGDYHYTSNSGRWPQCAADHSIAWNVVVTNALFIVRRLHRISSPDGGGNCRANMPEIRFPPRPFATVTKHYWVCVARHEGTPAELRMSGLS